MSEWKKVKLKDICSDIIDCVNKTAPVCDYETPYKMLRTSDIRNGQINTEGLKCVSKETFEKWNRRGYLQKGDVIFTREAPVGEVGWLKDPKNLFLGQRLMFFRADNKKCDNRFLFYSLFFSENKRSIIAKSNGSTVNHLRVPDCENIEIDIPDLQTQQNIASILSRYDSLIENYQKQIKLLEEAAQRLYKEWFIDLRFPGHENTKIVDGVPEGWKKNTINDVCTLITSGSTPSRNKNSYWEDGTIRWVKTKELLDSWILDTEEYITQEGYNNSSTKLFPANTILMAIYASPTLGRLGILSAECCCNQAALGLIADEKVISWQWLFWKLYELRDEFNAIARGVGQQNISGIVVKNKEIVIPAKRVIDGFTSVVSTMFEQQKNLQLQIRLLTEARDRLLPKLMSGEIAV